MTDTPDGFPKPKKKRKKVDPPPKIRRLQYGEPVPPGEPKRYYSASGYVRLRWRTGPDELVEVYEHRLVTNAPPGLHVHHINHVKDDNRPENLRLITPQEHGSEHRIMNDEQIRDLYLAGSSTVEVGRLLGYDTSAIWRSLERSGTPTRGLSESQRLPLDNEAIRFLYERGVSARRIGAEFGCTNLPIHVRLKEMGVPSRPVGAPTKERRREAEQALAQWRERGQRSA